MKKIRIMVGGLINILLSLIYCPLLMMAITDILGTTKGTAYTIQEPELLAYKTFGATLLFVLVIVFITAEITLKRFFFQSENKIYIINLCLFFLIILCLWPILYNM